jgi:hypothetical protein
MLVESLIRSKNRMKGGLNGILMDGRFLSRPFPRQSHSEKYAITVPGLFKVSAAPVMTPVPIVFEASVRN